MEFEDAAAFFNTTPVYDGYTNVLLFYARTSSHDDHSSSGATSRRRTLTTEPGNAAPLRSVVSTLGDRWLVGSSNIDNFDGAPIRISFDLKKVTALATLVTPGQAASNAAGVDLYIRHEWYRDQSDTMTSAAYYTMWNVFYAGTEPLVTGALLRLADGSLMRVRNQYLAQERLHIAECDQLDSDARQLAHFNTTGRLDIANDKLETDVRDAYILSLDVSKFFKYSDKADANYEPGDRLFLVAQTAVPDPKVGMQLTVGSARWQVMQVTPESDAWALRVRRA